MAVKKKESQGMTLPNNMAVVLGVGLVLGFVLGHLWTKVDLLEKGAGGTAGDPTAAAPQVPNEPRELKIAEPNPKEDHWKGPENARYVHVEYSDFECPFCQSYVDTMEGLMTDYPNMAFVYRHFPLSFHPLATPAAEASECVAELGGNEAFWKFHDIVFAAMPTVTVDGLGELAAQAGVNQASFQTCYDEGRYADKVAGQFNEGSTAGVGATPTSVIYDMETGETAVIEGALPLESAKQIIDGFIEQ